MKLLLSLLFFTSTVQAKDLYYIGNELGGKITLTDAKCNAINQFLIYSTNPKGKPFFGCYILSKSYVYVEWQNGKLDRYNFNNWNKLDYI